MNKLTSIVGAVVLAAGVAAVAWNLTASRPARVEATRETDIENRIQRLNPERHFRDDGRPEFIRFIASAH
jgi:hypothetical protein